MLRYCSICPHTCVTHPTYEAEWTNTRSQHTRTHPHTRSAAGAFLLAKCIKRIIVKC